MKYLEFNIYFIISLISMSLVINSNKLKIQSDTCTEFEGNDENHIINNTVLTSNNSNSTFFLFFSSII